jgi:hypothetical protein
MNRGSAKIKAYMIGNLEVITTEAVIHERTAPFADLATDLAVDFLLQQRPTY